MAAAPHAQIVVPEGFTLHMENTSHILLPPNNTAFLNPVQEFNRDLSVACIRTWSELLNEEKENKWKQNQERCARKLEKGPKAKRAKIEGEPLASAPAAEPHAEEAKPEHAPPPAEEPQTTEDPAKIASTSQKQNEYRPYKSVILEALSATGLRSIRYAKEIPLVKYVIANDLSPTAVEAMRRNVEINGLGRQDVSNEGPSETKSPELPKVRVNAGDACALMYNHRAEKDRVDVVDLDPYGTAAPFIDAAVQCVNDGGLLCVTCTDLAVLATTTYPEKCFSNYGGVSVRAEYSHDVALRLVLHTLSMSAARYGRYIQPLLSLSIDFYVRIFVRIRTSPFEVKKAFSKTSNYYVCSGCQAFYDQPFGRMVENVNPNNGNVNINFKVHAGPSVSDKCPECNSPMHVAGPMWTGSIHDPSFVARVLQHVEASSDKYGTATRMKGMLTVAKEELDTPFYFTPAKIGGLFHCECPSLDDTASALLNAGYQVSRSHAAAGSLKTTATRAELYDIFRSWVKEHPVRMEKVSQTSPTHQLLSKEPKAEASFKRHPQWMASKAANIKLVRYQENPQPNWGPGKKAGSGKRKRDHADD